MDVGSKVRRSVSRTFLATVFVLLAACAAPPAAPPPPPPPPPDPLASAADGVDVGACRDGICEVRAEAGITVPVDPRYGLDQVRIEPGAADMVTITGVITRAGSVHSDCLGADSDCKAGSVSLNSGSGNDPSMLTVEAGAGYRVNLPALTIETVAVRAGGAVVRFGHPTATDGTDLAACADGTCTVRVDGPATFPVDGRFGITEVRVRSVTADGAVLEIKPGPDVQDVTVACGPGDSLAECPTTFRPGRLTSTLLLGGEIRFPAVTIRVAAVDGPAAVIGLDAGQ